MTASQQPPMFYNQFVAESILFKYWQNEYKVKVPPHNTGWRTLPYTAILCACENDYICELSGGETITLREGMGVIIPSGVEHRMIMRCSGVISYIHILFSLSGIIDIFSMEKTPFLIEGSMEQAIEDCIHLLNINDFDDSEPFPLRKIIGQKEAAFRLAGLIMSVMDIRAGTFGKLGKLLKVFPVLDHIQNNLSSISCRKDLARLLNVSETRFHYIFKDATGLSPIAYLKEVRMRKAQILLLTTGLSVESISAQVGYQDSFNFSRSFKKDVGTSPMVYRKNGAASVLSNL